MTIFKENYYIKKLSKYHLNILLFMDKLLRMSSTIIINNPNKYFLKYLSFNKKNVREREGV